MRPGPPDGPCAPGPAAHTFSLGEASLLFTAAPLKLPTDRPKALYASGDAAGEDAAEGRLGKGLGAPAGCPAAADAREAVSPTWVLAHSD